MKRFFIYLFLLLFATNVTHAQTELVMCTTGYGFDASASNGINPGQWHAIQEFANLTYNGQNAGITAVRLHIQWEQYEPTANNYQRAKIVQAVQAILALKPGMKVALHFPYQRPGPQPGQSLDGFIAEEDIARVSDGTLAQQTITYTLPSMYSATARNKFYAFVSDVMDQLTSYYSSILYVQMGNGSAEEFVIPNITRNNNIEQAFYEQKALDAWRTEYLPCRYPGQSTVTWGGNTYNIASAPPANYNYNWNSGDHSKEYHRFAGWGLMKFYKGFRDIIKNHSSNLKVLYFISDFGSAQGNALFMHNSTLPMAMQEFDGIYSSDGVGQYDGATKIRAIDVMKGTSPNKISAIEFDPDDLGQVLGQDPINASIAAEWMPRAYKHGVNYIHLAMHYPDVAISQLAQTFANLRANYVNGSYTAPSRQSPVSVNIYPNVFTGTHLFQSTWDNNSGSNWSSTDNNPVSINMTDGGYWDNIWNCSSSNPCDYNLTASGPSGNVAPNASVTLNSTCSGQCSGVSYSWSGNGISGSSSSVTFNAPATTGTYTYTITGTKSNCSNKTATVNVVVSSQSGSPFSQCLESESSSGNGSITSDPNASNGDTRGVENNNNHYVDYAVTSVPSAGTYAVTLRYYSSTAPTVSVQVNGGSGQTINLANSGSWNIVPTTQTFNVTLASGNNTIRISGTGGGSCRQDKICVEGSGGGCSTPSAPSLSASASTITSGQSSTLSATGCSGGTITWSHTLGTGTPKTVSPTVTTTYTATCTIDGCTSSNGSVTLTVETGSSSFSQCLESESMSGNGSITSDPNASNGNTRGEENNNNHYVDYAVTGVPSAGTYYVKLRYYSSSAPTVSVSVNSGTGQTVNLSNSGSWNIVWTEQTIAVSLASGNNTIRISGTGGGSCRQDKICVSNNSGSSAVLDPLRPDEMVNLNMGKGLLISPNPGRGIFQTRFYLATGKKASIIVTDVQGRIVHQQYVTGRGMHNERIDLTNKASGMLFMRLQKTDGVEVKKVNIVR